MKLLQVDSIEEARAKLLEHVRDKQVETETVSLEEAAGRILARDIVSRENIPAFYRSTVDGYAVRSKDTAGATESLPVFLEVIEEVAIGTKAEKAVRPGTCAYVPTGGMIPEGADAMVMVEYSELFDESHVALYASAAYGASVVVPGEDVKEDGLLLARGTVLSSAQIGALAASGICEVEVFKSWTVTVLSTGDELVEAAAQPEYGQVRDINGWTIAAQSEACGMKVVRRALLGDDEELIKSEVRRAMEEGDLLLTSGGSSQGKKDLTEQIFAGAACPGVFTHGLALKPGKPTILGYDSGTETVLAGLPGHPAAALLVFRLLIEWLWREKTGQKPAPCLTAQMETNIAGAPGKTTCLLVELLPVTAVAGEMPVVGEVSGAGNTPAAGERAGMDGMSGAAYIARPVLGRSGLITTMTRACGYVMIGMNCEGLKKGETVLVHPF